eukprot:TRINITY_DN4505_c0_g1_i1.p1 TRINITY_DN4505_c0_g1~~TRINITY_DN4505_c0_g1_i1.p1  ORF type:complete len:397 (-),score=119.29 TRINITY_DN4505_c0_g1_i1:26-1216(-)
MKLQSMFGIIPRLKGKGTCSKLIIDMLLRMRREMGGDEPLISPDIDQLILIDREIDMVTPMCTQLTYEGLIDEVFGIHNSYVDLDPEIVGSQKGGKNVKVALNSNDKLFMDIRNLNFSVLLPILNKKAKEIDEYYKQRHAAQSVSQMRDFVKKFASAQTEHASLRTHTGISEKILAVTKDPAFHRRLEVEQSLLAGEDVSGDYIEECIARQEPLEKVLRLLCLHSLTNNGLKVKLYEFFRREILQTYGYEFIFTLNNLEKLGLFKKQEGKNNFALLRKNMHLIVEDIDEHNPNDFAYVYSGYAPLSVRVVQAAFKGGFKTREDLRLLPGPTVEEVQNLPGGVDSGSSNRVTLVFFVGGITFTEIAALRWLSKHEGYGDIICATTNMITGDSFFASI